MPKRISLEDPNRADTEERVASNELTEVAEKIYILLEKMDWKLWELYKTGKRVEKYLDIENLDVTQEKK